MISEHLEFRKKGDLESDLARNYHENIVIITNHGNFKGHDGIRASNKILQDIIPSSKFKIISLLFEKDIAFEFWEAKVNNKVLRGIDTFFVKRGKIRIQSAVYPI